MFHNQDFLSDVSEVQRPSMEQVRGQLGRMLHCRLFRHSPRLSRFFTFTVDQALAGCEQRLKEYSIALEVFGKPETFDPRLDSAVRVAARQLRAKIDLYYLTEGAQDPILVRYRPGDYIPRFYHRSDSSVPRTTEYEAADGYNRPAILVEKDRTSIRTLTDCFDSMSYPIANVVDCGERCLDVKRELGPCIVVTGLNLMGSMNGTTLARALRSDENTAVVMLIPSTIDGQLLEELLDSEPDAVVYEPVRPTDLRTAMRLAVTRLNSRSRAERQTELASCA